MKFYRYVSTKPKRIPANCKKIQTLLAHTANLNINERGEHEGADTGTDESSEESAASTSSYESFKTQWPKP